MVDDKLIDDTAINIKLAATLANPDFKGNLRKPERGIVRFQMMEVNTNNTMFFKDLIFTLI
jgi:hypothetical protein